MSCRCCAARRGAWWTRWRSRRSTRCCWRRSLAGDVVALPMPHLARLRGDDENLAPILATGQQTNNSVIFGERLIMKLFRRIEEGVHPDLEMSRFLTDVGFPNVAPVA